MSIVTIEVLPDTSQPAGGHAIIRLKGVALLPPGATFRIAPIDDTLADFEQPGWPHGDRHPLTTRQTPEGIELHVGPEIVDAPLLEPGTPVTISVPDGHVSAELVWPDLPMSSGASLAPFVMTPSQMAAELAAHERAKTEATAAAETKRLAEAATERAKAAPKPQASKIPPAPEAVTEQERMAAAARELEAALALERNDPQPAHPAVDVSTKYSGKLTSEALSTLANTTGVNGSAQPAPSSERPRTNTSSLSSLTNKPTLDRVEPLTLQPDRDVSLPTVILKHARETQSGVAGDVEPTRLRREGFDEAQSRQTRPSRVWPFVAGAGAAAVAALSVFAIMALRPQATLRSSAGGEIATAVTQKATLAEAFTVGVQSPRGEIASDVDLPTALRLADYNLHGIDRPIDRAEAEFWLKKAMSLTASHSQIRWALTQLGTLAAEPVTGAPDYERARLLWEIAAANGDPVALCFLGTLAENGLGLALDRAKALDYYKRSKDFGGCPSSDEAIARLSK